jgi:hypothetical protein
LRKSDTISRLEPRCNFGNNTAPNTPNELYFNIGDASNTEWFIEKDGINMDRQLIQCLEGTGDNYILPFFWQRHEDEITLRHYMQQIHNCGIGAVCVESRTHPDFAGELWWQDMDIIMDEARQLEMRVWVLDDRSFPTGNANGKAQLLPDHLRKRCLIHMRDIDVVGPMLGAYILYQTTGTNIFAPEGEIPLPPPDVTAAIAIRINVDAQGEAYEDEHEIIDISDGIKNGRIYWDIPAGRWKIVLIQEAIPSGTWTATHLNHMIAESTDCLINEVYEPHYAHYKADFGKTFAGFFSDEPGFYCEKGEMAPLGSKNSEMQLPWCPQMWQELSAVLGEDCKRLLPCLWMDLGDVGARVRYLYTDIVTRRYQENFAGHLGNWCRTHGVEYIGHVIEDENDHGRLKVSGGHYFRALWGQDMSGVDVVLSQLLPGLDTQMETLWKRDGEFYHYSLAKLASSLAHVDPKKHNRAMCEMFGAYGWGEGLKLMKWLTDHMLVRGINHFVPHAFCPAPFPEPDCPPHFYAHGNNPQFRYMKRLMDYTNRLAHLLFSDGHIAQSAILYNAEAEWSGKSQPVQKPARQLTCAQIDFDFIPADLLANANVMNGRLILNNNAYSVLVIPYAERLPLACLNHLAVFSEHMPVLFVDAFPDSAVDGNGEKALFCLRRSAQAIELTELAKYFLMRGIVDVQTEPASRWLRTYHVSRQNADIYMLFNESPYDTLSCRVTLPIVGNVVRYDAMSNRIHHQPCLQDVNTTGIDLCLSPYESAIYVFGEVQGKQYSVIPNRGAGQIQTVDGPFSLSVSAYDAKGVFTQPVPIETLFDLASSDEYTRFSGTMRYDFTFEAITNTDRIFLDLGKVYETADVLINDFQAGICICPPYRLEITDLVVPGHNKITINVTNTLVKSHPDYFSIGMVQDPSGLLGPVTIEYISEE